MLPVGIALVVGVLLGNSSLCVRLLPYLPYVLVALLILSAVTLRYRHLNLPFLYLSLLVLGAFRGSTVATSVPQNLPQAEVEYEAVVTSEPVVHGKVVWMDLLVVNSGKPMAVQASLLRDTIDHRYRQLHVGSGIRAFSKFAFERHRLRTFIYYSHWRLEAVDLRSLSYYQRARLRLLHLRQSVAGVLSDNAVARAMVLGDKTLLTRDLRTDYSLAGVSHLLALSGLHLGIIYALLSFVFFRFRRHWICHFLILLVIWSYALLVGMMPSVVRSACMLTIYSFAAFLGRDRLSINTWALAGVVMLMVTPESLWDVGFLMSFLAVFFILLFVPAIIRLPLLSRLRQCRFGRWCVDMFAVTLAAQVGTIPLVAFVFGRVPVYGLLLNFVAVPLAVVIICLSILCLCVSWSPSILTHALSLLDFFGSALNTIVSFVASLPGAAIHISLSLAQTLCCYLLLFSLFLLFNKLSILTRSHSFYNT